MESKNSPIPRSPATRSPPPSIGKGVARLDFAEIGLAHVAANDQLAAVQDLGRLVLGVVVDDDLQSVDAGGEVIAGGTWVWGAA